MANFVGTWEDTGEREGYDEFAAAMDFTPELKEMYQNIKQTQKYSISGNTWTLVMTSSFFPGKEKTYTFEIGKEKNETGLDGSDIKFTVNVVSDNEINEDMKVKMKDAWVDYKFIKKVDGNTMTTRVTASGNTMTTKQRRL